MKPQSHFASLLEAGQNIVVGFAISVAATYFLGPFFHMKPGVGDVLGFGGVMTLISIARSYGIRRWNEFKRGKNVPPSFMYIVEEFAAERTRQITGEGYSLDHDDEHTDGEIARGAAAYCLAGANRIDGLAAAKIEAKPIAGSRVDAIRKAWPWAISAFKPTTARRNLVKAGAMIIAEIGRIDRARDRP